MGIQRRQMQQFTSYKLVGCGYGQRPAKDQRCRPARMGVWLMLTNIFQPGPTATTESNQATDPGMTQAWQMLTFLCHGFPQSWAFHQEWALLVTRLWERRRHIWGEQGEKHRVGWTQHGARHQDKARRLSGWVTTGQHVDKAQKTLLCSWNGIVRYIGAGS